MSNKLNEYLPIYIQKYREIENIMIGEQPEFDNLQIEKEQILKNAFVSECNEYGATRYETITGIDKDLNATLDSRKLDILAKMNEQLPYTMTTLKTRLKALCGVNNFFVVLKHTEYYIEIKLKLAVKGRKNTVQKMLDKTLPANLIKNVTIMYNTHKLLKPFKHGELRVYTHKNLKEDVLKNGKNA